MIVLGAVFLLWSFPASAAVTGTLLPNGSGDRQWTRVPSGTAQSTAIDESVCNGETDYLRETTIGERQTSFIDVSSIPEGSTITGIAITPCASLDVSGIGTGVLNVFYKWNHVRSTDIGGYFLSGTTPVPLAAATWTGVSHFKQGPVLLEIGAVYSSGNLGARVSRMAVVVTYGMPALTPVVPTPPVTPPPVTPPPPPLIPLIPVVPPPAPEPVVDPAPLPEEAPVPQDGVDETSDPCAKAMAGASCVESEDECAASPYDGGTSTCVPETYFCCIKKEIPPDPAANPSTPGSSISLPDPLGGLTVPEVVGRIIRSFTGVAGAIALLMFVWGGVKWIISGGKENEVKEAQQILRNATIGLILIFGAYFFTSAVIQGLLTNPN